MGDRNTNQADKYMISFNVEVSPMKKKQAGWGLEQTSVGPEQESLCRSVREKSVRKGLSDKVALEKWSEQSEGESFGNRWDSAIQA